MKRFLLLLLCAAYSYTATAQARFWTWSGYSDQRDWDSYFEELTDVGITGILLSANKEQYEKVVPIAKKHKVELQAWIWIMCNRAIAKEHPEWLDYNQKGESIRDKKAYVDYYQFLNPIIPGVQKAIVEHVSEIASIDGLSGISLDYCRYVDAILPTSLWEKYGIVQDKVYPEWDYGYHPDMIEAFIKEHGYDPRKQDDINSDKLWHQFRMDKVNDIVEMLVEVAHERDIEITASPFPTPEMSRTMVYQDWGKWRLDKAFPMIYSGFYYGDLDWIAECVKDCRRDMYKDAELYFGLFVPSYKDTEFTIFDAMNTAFDNGAEGVSFFGYESLTDDQRAGMKEFIKTKTKELNKRYK